MPTILIVEDNEDIRLNLVEYLESKNYQTDNTDDGLKALALTIVNKYDLIVLDIMIPGMDGLRLCRELRSRGNTTPIIILSAKDSTDDRIMGLSEGADDYIVKPFSLAELLLRIQAVLRRSSTPEEKVLQVGNLRLELDSKRVFRGDTELKLNPTAFRILAFLMQKSPEVVSREEIEDAPCSTRSFSVAIPSADAPPRTPYTTIFSSKGLIPCVTAVSWRLSPRRGY